MNQPAKDQGTSGGSADSVGPNLVILSGTPAVQARFTGWSLPAGGGDHFHDASGRATPTTFRDCQFSGGQFTIHPGSVSLVNCLWQRVYVTLREDDNLQWHLFNNLFYGGTLSYRALSDDPVLEAYDNFFDRTTITRGTASQYFTHDHNGYISGQSRLLPSPAPNDVVLGSMAYVPGPRGEFYHGQTDLEDQGSRSAADAGLSGYTVRADQMPDEDDVDIGFHYFLTPPCDEPVISGWVFTDEGFIAGNQNGAFRTYNNPSGVPASPWSFLSPDRRSFRIAFEDDGVTCSGSNQLVQIATVEAVVKVGCPTQMTFSWDGIVEWENSGYDRMNLYVDDVEIASAQSREQRRGCSYMGSPDSSPQSPICVPLDPGMHWLMLRADTVDERYHVGAYYQFQLNFQPQ